MNKSLRSPKEKEKIVLWLLNPASKIESLLLSLFFLLLPTQLGKHFWPNFSSVSGIRIDYLSPILYVTDFLIVLLFISFLLRQIKFFRSSKLKAQSSKLHLKTKSSIFLYSLVILFIVTNSIFAQRPLLSIYGFIKLLELGFLASYLAKSICQRFQLEYLSLLFTVSAIFESTLAVFQYIHQGSLNGIFYFFGERSFTGATPGIANASINGSLVLRPYATFPHPNVLAGYLLVTMVLVWSFVLRSSKRWMQIWGSLSLLASSVALLLTFSRVTILLWTLFILFLFFRLVFSNLKAHKAKGLVLGIIVIAIACISLFPLMHEVIFRFANTSLSEESVTERTELLSASWTIIQHHPILGVGLDNFIPALAPLQKPLPLNLYLQPVHNIFVLIAAETGIVGFGLFIWFLLATLLQIKKQKSRVQLTFYVLLLFISVTGFFDHYWLTLQQGQLLFVTVIGLSWAKITHKRYNASNGK